MKISQIDDYNILEVLKITDLENAFDTYVDKNLNRMFNLNKGIYIAADMEQLPKF